MNELNGNTPSELLNLLVDGELNTAGETTLFANLAENEELRGELRDLLAIRESVRNDTEAFATPPEATHGVFKQLGFAVPAYLKPVPTGSGISPFTSFINRIWVPTASAIVGSIITALLFINFYEKPVTSQTVEQPIISSRNLNTFPEKYPVVTSSDINNDNRKHPNLKKRVSPFNSINQNIKNDNIINNENNENIKNNITSAEIIPSGTQEEMSVLNNIPSAVLFADANIKGEHFNTLSRNLVNGINQIDAITISPLPGNLGIGNRNFLQNKSGHFGLMLQVRGISAKSYPVINVEPQAMPVFSNMGVAAYLYNTGNFSFGMELGQEPFGQEFWNVEDNTPKRVKQNPLLLWMGGTVRYVYPQKFETIAGGQPFSQITLGTTGLGPMGKLVGGIQFVSQSGWGFIFGVEGCLMNYQNQNQSYYSKKIGFTYGVSYKL